MKTIELISGKQKAQFTTKSVTFDGKEYFYSNMSHVANHEEQCFYTFTYQGETKTLPYEKKDSKILAAIFSQVKALESAASTAAKASAAEKAPIEASEKKQQPAVSQSHASEDEDVVVEHSQETPEQASSQQEQEDAVDAPIDVKAEKKAEKQRIKAQKKTEKKAAAADKKAQCDSKEKNPEKTQKIKKSLIIFGIIVAVIALLSLIYFLIFGTKEEPTTINPSVQESQSYDDIDELINDLQ